MRSKVIEACFEDLVILNKRGITPKYVDDNGIVVLNQKCIRDFVVSLEPSRLTSKMKVAEEKLLQNYDVLVNSTGVGTLGRVAQIKLINQPMTVDSHVTILRGNKNKVDLEYFGHLVKNKQNTIEALAEGSTGQTELSRVLLGQVKVLVHTDLYDQKKIAHILSTLDNKIELNRKMNQTLEAMAQALFKSWFVDFEPFQEGEFVESELGMIPRGWDVSSIGAETTSVGGATPSTTNPEFWEDGEFYWATPRDLSSVQEKILIETERKITNTGVKKISSGQLPVGTILLSSRAPIGYLAMSTIPVSINQGFIAMICNKRLPNTYVLQWVTYKLDDIKQRGSGTTFAEISKSTFRPMQILVPDSKNLQKYDEIVQAYYNQITINIQETQTLQKTRDALLPKLLSGELDVSEIEL